LSRGTLWLLAVVIGGGCASGPVDPANANQPLIAAAARLRTDALSASRNLIKAEGGGR
jgi:hypothetical protein